MPEEHNLTPRKLLFATEYLIDFNGEQAAGRAGYSKKTAASQASRLLKDANVKAYIDGKMEERTKKIEATAENVLNELAKIAFVTVDDFYNRNGSVKYLHELEPHVRAAISSYNIKTITIGSGEDKETIDIPQFKAHDKVKTLELLGKHFAMFEGKDATPGPKAQNKRVTIARRSDRKK